MPIDKLELRRLAKEALAVQDACNLSGVVHGFSKAVTDLRKALGSEADTATINTHPIVKLWVDKLCHLSRHDTNDLLGKEYDAIHEMAAYQESSDGKED